MPYPFRTDLALEATEPHSASLPPGVEQNTRQSGNLEIHTVVISSREGVERIGKPQGRYVTVTAPSFSSSVEIEEPEIEEVAREIRALLPSEGLVLVVGLGNNDITPDAVGPRTIHQILATRHFEGQLAEDSGLGRLRPTAAIAPGVLGQTGIETAEIIRSLVEDIKPEAVVVVDALAARSTDRLGNTVQIANSGISPGAGVMNSRKELSRETLGIPVVSIGVPTVVDASTLAGDLLETGLEEKQMLFEPRGRAMMITPREIDVLISHACKVLSLSINKALQPDLTLEEISYLVS